MRPRVLDLFCGAGGAGRGYYDAGFDVVGVDIEPQPHYPFEFIQADALTFPLEGFDVIHASPPCQHYSVSSLYYRLHGKTYVDLIAPMRARLVDRGTPWVIENVRLAPLETPLLLCGSMFGLMVQRHRFFESPWLMDTLSPYSCRHDYIPFTVTGNGTPSWSRRKNQTADECRAAMGIDWMSRAELSQAIPPTYTEWIGRRLLAVIENAT